MRDSQSLISRKRLYQCVSIDLLGYVMPIEDVYEEIGRADFFINAPSPPPDTLIRRIKILRQLEGIWKKEVPPEGVTQRMKDDAVTRLLHIDDDLPDIVDDSTHRGIRRARDFIHDFLPPVEFLLEEISENCAFGPGSVFHAKGKWDCSIFRKIGGTQTFTRNSAELVFEVLSNHFPKWFELEIEACEAVRGNRLAFVPKDKEKCRVIAVEPSLNMFVQQGIGKTLANLLCKREATNIRDQARNKNLARMGSIDGTISTIDLSDASDRISDSLVRYLLPCDWYALLSSAVSLQTKLPNGSWRRFKRFSSQGNAFTFPLETLIFYSLLWATCEDKKIISAYGDDLIVSTSDYQSAVEILQSCGFSVNLKKSFSKGWFRESCGGDFICGKPVRPYYYKEDALLYSDVAKTHNLLYSMWLGEIPTTLEYLRDCVPKGKAIYGPVFKVSQTDNVDGILNTLDENVQGWFMIPDFQPRKYFYDKDLHGFYYKQKSWALSSYVPPKLKSDISAVVSELAFLYTGRDPSTTSPFFRHITKLEVLPLPCGDGC